MKKSILIIAFFAASVIGYAQEADNFIIGPYEVDYYGPSDYEFRQRKDVTDLREYFDLKTDTVVVMVEKKDRLPLGIQVGISGRASLFSLSGDTRFWGLDVSWKQRLHECIYFNSGIMAGLTSWRNTGRDIARATLIVETGIPLSVEFTEWDGIHASPFISIGATPAYYVTPYSKSEMNGIVSEVSRVQGCYVAPRMDFGIYVPIKGTMLRIGILAQYNMDVVSGDSSIYDSKLGRMVAGISGGIVF